MEKGNRFQIESRWCSMMTTLFVVWIAFTVIFVLLLIYRGTLSMHEDDQLFLDTAEDHMQREQQELISKMNRITPWVRISGAGSAVLILLMGGLALYNNMTR
jgi:hypothetical protein